jgi:hypothetical protein
MTIFDHQLENVPECALYTLANSNTQLHDLKPNSFGEKKIFT